MSLSSYAKEYLVRLGFSLDNNSLSDALSAVKDGSSQITNLMSKFSDSYIKGAASIVGFVASATVAISNLVKSVAEADMQTQLSARSMWMSTDAYRALETSVQSLGYSMSDLSSIAMNSELTGQLQELVNLSKQTDAPKELDAYLAKVRQVSFEFNKLKVLIKSGVRNVVYEFLKMSNTDLNKTHQTVKNVISYIQEKLPSISKKIANVLYVVVQIGKALFGVLKWIIEIFKKLFDYFKQTPKKFAIMMSAITAVLLLMNPVLTAITAALTGIFLLVDDYLGWKNGKNSFFGDKWKTIESIAKDVADFLSDIIEAVETIIDGLWEVFKWIKDKVVDPLVGWIKDTKGKTEEDIDKAIENGDISEEMGKYMKASLNPSIMENSLGNVLLGSLWDQLTGKNDMSWSEWFKNIFSTQEKTASTNASIVTGSNNKTYNSYKQNITVQGNMTDTQASNMNKYFSKIAKGKNLASVVR